MLLVVGVVVHFGMISLTFVVAVVRDYSMKMTDVTCLVDVVGVVIALEIFVLAGVKFV